MLLSYLKCLSMQYINISIYLYLYMNIYRYIIIIIILFNNIEYISILLNSIY